MPSEVGSELHRFEQIAPTLFIREEPKLSPGKRVERGQFPKKPRGFYVEEMRGGGLEPRVSSRKMRTISSAWWPKRPKRSLKCYRAGTPAKEATLSAWPQSTKVPARRLRSSAPARSAATEAGLRIRRSAAVWYLTLLALRRAASGWYRTALRLRLHLNVPVEQ